MAGAPTRTLGPSMETDQPKPESSGASEAVSSAVCVMSTQPVLGCTKTYALPVVNSPCGAPTTTVEPLMETEYPKESRSMPSDDVSSAVWVMFRQPPGGCT